MSLSHPGDAVAFRVADHLTGKEPWEVFGERIRRYEIHIAGDQVEMTRGPITLEGYGLRIFRSHETGTGIGFQASNDLSPEGVAAAEEDAERAARYALFPAPQVELPSGHGATGGIVEVFDRKLWEYPMDTLETYVAALRAAFEGRKEFAISFGSVRATLSSTSISNSAGLRTGYGHTTIDLEVAVEAFGGPEGPPPGEYWLNDSDRRSLPAELSVRAGRWCRYAEDVRRGKPPPTGEMSVVLPPQVLAGILPVVFGGRFTGEAQLRKVAPQPGARLGTELATVYDDGRIPWAPMSSGVDDEGVPQRRRTLLDHGVVSDTLYDTLHAGAFGAHSSGNAFRGQSSGFRTWYRFLAPPTVSPSTIVLAPGDGGTDAEIVEAAHEGVWIQQIGWSAPDPLTGAFGGEIRLGYRIRDGKLAESIRGGTVGGIALAAEGSPSLMTRLEAVGSRPAFSEAVLSPPVLVRTLSVGGET
jgi:predicted Zn-dependent protease